MARTISGRPDLYGTHSATLKTVPARVLRTEDAATTDSQRQTLMGVLRSNAVVDRVNALSLPPFGSGELLTMPDSNGNRDSMLSIVAGDNDFSHTLGHVVNGFIVVDLQVRGDVTLYRVSVSRSFDERKVRIHSAHACSAKIWVW